MISIKVTLIQILQYESNNYRSKHFLTYFFLQRKEEKERKRDKKMLIFAYVQMLNVSHDLYLKLCSICSILAFKRKVAQDLQ